MNGYRYISTFLTLLLSLAVCVPAGGREHWRAPFDPTAATAGIDRTNLSLQGALTLVAARNPMLQSLDFRREALRGRIDQAKVRPNPELEAEFGDVGWDAPGLTEAEIVVALSQEFELFGQRGARVEVAAAELDAGMFETRVAAFDLYLKTSDCFYRVVHAQEQYRLSAESIQLAGNIVATMQDRIDKGAALHSELLLARLELQRGELARAEAEAELTAARIDLASLWGGDSPDVKAAAVDEPELAPVLEEVVLTMADSTRQVLAAVRYRDQLQAERRLAAVESKPNVTLRGGYKRSRADGSNSLLFGLALPLPFRNQNRGDLQRLEARMQELDFEIRQARLESRAAVESGLARLRHLSDRHAAIDEKLLPTAEDAYRALQGLYEAGRLPYTSLLEAERSLVELKFEHNDVLLAIRRQVIAIERVVGVILQTE